MPKTSPSKTPEPKTPKAKTRVKRSVASEGDEIGAAEFGRRVAANVRTLRKARGMSLDTLSQASGASRAALSQIETGKTNPSIGLLWKIAAGLGVRFSELIDEPVSAVQVLKREDMQVLRSVDGRFESRPMAPAGASGLAEVYELRLLGRTVHASDAHAAGTREILIVLSGRLRISVAGEVHDLSAGDSIVFPSDVPHTYENPAPGEARCHNIVIYGR